MGIGRIMIGSSFKTCQSPSPLLPPLPAGREASRHKIKPDKTKKTLGEKEKRKSNVDGKINVEGSNENGNQAAR